MVENFGERMVRYKRERGLPIAGPGRKPLAAKYGKQIAAAEATFAAALPGVAAQYIAELTTAAPERCPDHGRVLACPVVGCGTVSERREFDHRAAAYALDRLMGRPSIHVEQSVTVRLVNELVGMVASAFREVNPIGSADERAAAFAARVRELADGYSRN